jgi:hypothetical protein
MHQGWPYVWDELGNRTQLISSQGCYGSYGSFLWSALVESLAKEQVLLHPILLHPKQLLKSVAT